MLSMSGLTYFKVKSAIIFGEKVRRLGHAFPGHKSFDEICAIATTDAKFIVFRIELPSIEKQDNIPPFVLNQSSVEFNITEDCMKQFFGDDQFVTRFSDNLQHRNA